MSLDVLVASSNSPVTVWYCKTGIEDGTTVCVQQKGPVIECAGIRLQHDLGLFAAEMRHGNSCRKAKESGARTVLVVTEGLVIIEQDHEN